MAMQATQSSCSSAVRQSILVRVVSPWTPAVSDILAPLTIDFLTWLAAEPRDYIDVMDAWRTSCPRLTIREDAIDARLVTRVHISGRPIRIELTQRGEALLAAHSRVNIGFPHQPPQCGAGGNSVDRASGVNPRQQRLDQAGLSGMLYRLSLRRDILCEFSEHLGAQLDRIFHVQRDPRHPGDGIAAQRRQSLNDVEGPLVGRSALASVSTLARLGSASSHDLNAYSALP